MLDVCNVTEVVSQRYRTLGLGCLPCALWFSARFRTILLEKPDVVVGTPSRILAHLQQRVS